MLTQTFLNTLVATAAILPLAIDVFLIYRLFRFFPFSSAAIYGLAPYLVLILGMEDRLLPGLLLVGLVVVVVAIGSGAFFYEIGHRRGGSSLQLLLLSMGLMIVVQNSVALHFGRQPIPLGWFEGAPLRWGEVTLGGPRLAALIWGLLTLAVILGIQRFTRLGLEWRALANDPELARVVGLRPRRALMTAFCFGALCTAGAGILQAADTAMRADMGLRAFMVAAVAVVVGGERLWGVVLATILVATTLNFGIYFLGGRWQDVVVFGILLGFLLLRPQGLASVVSMERAA